MSRTAARLPGVVPLDDWRPQPVACTWRTVFEAYVEDAGQGAEPVSSCGYRVTSGGRADARQDETADDVDSRLHPCVPP